VTAIAELVLADDPAAWRAIGFSVDDEGVALVGTVRLRFTGEPAAGVTRWMLAGMPDEDVVDVDGLATSVGEPSPAGSAGAGDGHPNGALAIDHLVVTTPDLTRTTTAIERRLGLPLRRVREAGSPERPLQQGFFRVGEVVLEVVGPPAVAAGGPAPSGPARFYGLAFTMGSLDDAVTLLGPDRVSEIRLAVQPGRSIATVRAVAGLGVPVALMSA
jgi:hypothetical protein